MPLLEPANDGNLGENSRAIPGYCEGNIERKQQKKKKQMASVRFHHALLSVLPMVCAAAAPARLPPLFYTPLSDNLLANGFLARFFTHGAFFVLTFFIIK